MRRRTMLRLGVGSAVALAVLGGSLAMIKPGFENGRLTSRGRQIFRAIALSTLDTILPVPTGPAVDLLLIRLETAITSLPFSTQSELGQLLALLSAAPTRHLLAGLSTDWSTASVEDVQQALRHMRMSKLELPQQAYQALRDLTVAAYFADRSAWTFIDYPGPVAL